VEVVVAIDGQGGHGEGPIDDLTPYPIGLDEVAERQRRHLRVGTVVSIVAAVLLVAGVVALRHDRSGPPDLVRDDDAETALTLPDPTTPDPSVPEITATETLGLGSPIDGKESLLHPVQVVPDTDLVDGQQVDVKGSGFRPNVQVAAVTCTVAAVRDGVTACDILSNVVYARTDAGGNVTIPYRFKRFVTIGGRHVDCQQGNVDPAEFADRATRGVVPLVPAGSWNGCLIAIGMPDDYDESGGSPVLMRGATPLPMPSGTTPPSTTAPMPAPTAPAPTAPSSPPPTPPTTVLPPPTEVIAPEPNTEVSIIPPVTLVRPDPGAAPDGTNP
jgi:hypothetical protein